MRLAEFPHLSYDTVFISFLEAPLCVYIAYSVLPLLKSVGVRTVPIPAAVSDNMKLARL